MSQAEQFRKRCLSPFFRLFLLMRLPLAYLVGVKVKSFDSKEVRTTVKLNWLTKNPFKSLYFAVLQMAAELSTGLHLFQYLNKETQFSMLLVSVRSTFTKKAVGKIEFVCQEGIDAQEMVSKLMKTNEGITKIFKVIALNALQQEVATFEFEWSCKKR